MLSLSSLPLPSLSVTVLIMHYMLSSCALSLSSLFSLHCFHCYSHRPFLSQLSVHSLSLLHSLPSLPMLSITITHFHPAFTVMHCFIVINAVTVFTIITASLPSLSSLLTLSSPGILKHPCYLLLSFYYMFIACMPIP